MFNDIKTLVSQLITTVRKRFEVVENDVATVKRDLTEVKQFVDIMRSGNLGDLAAEVATLGNGGPSAGASTGPLAPVATTQGSSTITVDAAAGTTTVTDPIASTTTTLDHATGSVSTTHDPTGATVVTDPNAVAAASNAAAAAGVNVPATAPVA